MASAALRAARGLPASDLARYLWTEPGAEPIYARAAREAGLTLPD